MYRSPMGFAAISFFLSFFFFLLYSMVFFMTAPTGRVGSLVWDVRAKVIPFSGPVIKLIKADLII